MARLRVLAFAAAAACSTPAIAGPSDATASNLQAFSRFSGVPPIQIERKGFSFPVIEYAEPTGAIQQRKGIIAGKKVAPGTVLGFGIFQTAPKMRGYVGDVPQNMAPRRSKRAAIGLSMRF